MLTHYICVHFHLDRVVISMWLSSWQTFLLHAISKSVQLGREDWQVGSSKAYHNKHENLSPNPWCSHRKWGVITYVYNHSPGGDQWQEDCWGSLATNPAPGFQRDPVSKRKSVSNWWTHGGLCASHIYSVLCTSTCVHMHAHTYTHTRHTHRTNTHNVKLKKISTAA